jgi:asparagine synthase (glutamine-hydrolysing)
MASGRAAFPSLVSDAMCGIAGIYNFRDNEPVDGATVEAMTDRLQHRGPDDRGFYIAGPLALGMRRLSIIDLAGGGQPITNEDGTVQVVFNGEIYNHKTLRGEIEARGHRLRSRADTEVIAHGYEIWGPQVLERLNGMFAIAIWDASRRRLLLARDRIGIKPLYYAETSSGLVFASELKSLLILPEIERDIDHAAIQEFLAWEFISSPRTPFTTVRKLPPATYLSIDPRGMRDEVYWNLQPGRPETSLPAAQEGIRWHLNRSARLQREADVPVGVFLSGGMDSSALVATLSDAGGGTVRTFCIGFGENDYDETAHASRVAQAFGTVHEEAILRPDCRDLLEEVASFVDEPFADNSILPTYLVSRLARRHVKVALSGDGGDELFGGYDRYKAHRLAGWYAGLPAFARRRLERGREPAADGRPLKHGSWRTQLHRLQSAIGLPGSLEHARWMMRTGRGLLNEVLEANPDGTGRDGWMDPLLRAFRRSPFEAGLNRQLHVDIQTYLVDDILFKTDRASMATSLEARVPFLDHELVEYVFRLPDHWKLRLLEGKWILRRSFRKRLPAGILRRRKSGFSIPVASWLRGELRDMLHDLLAPARLRQQGIFRAGTVSRLLREHDDRAANHARTLWALLIYQLWEERFGCKGTASQIDSPGAARAEAGIP